jgi:hypothetical protein
MRHVRVLDALRRHLASWPLIGVCGAIYVVSQVTIALTVHALGADMLLVQTTLSAEHVRAIFAHWDATGLIGNYAAHYRYDMIHPLWYGTLLAALLAKSFEANDLPASRNAWLLVPFAAGACDVVENLVHLSFLADRANITRGAVLLGNGAALAKWTLTAGAITAVLVLAATALRHHSGRGNT